MYSCLRKTHGRELLPVPFALLKTGSMTQCRDSDYAASDRKNWGGGAAPRDPSIGDLARLALRHYMHAGKAGASGNPGLRAAQGLAPSSEGRLMPPPTRR